MGLSLSKPGTSVTIGNFDGCHLGHQRLIALAIAEARELGLTSLALTFRPRPEAFFSGKSDHENSLFTAVQKTRAFAELGIDFCVAQRFDFAFSQIGHEAFYDKILRDELQASALAVGHDFRFGAGRLGDITYLKDRCQQDQVELRMVEPIAFAGMPISSSRIRQTLRGDGDVAAAAGMLGRPYLLEGTIETGRKLGRSLGFPTINLGSVSQLVPQKGIYAAAVVLTGGRFGEGLPDVMQVPKAAFPAAVSIGVNPTVVDAGGLTIEAHLLGGNFGPDELYGLTASVFFLERLRDEMKFSTVEELKAQIQRDCEAVLRMN